MQHAVSQSDLPAYKQIQVEATSRCNLRCRTCLYAYFESQWQARDLSEKAFQRIVDIAHRCESIHLQGWGESLLRPDYPDMIKRLKEKGCQVTLSSNGTRMNSSIAENLIHAELDSMAFSLAGISADAQDPLRGQGTFDTACRSVRLFAQIRPAKSQPPLLVNLLLTPDTVKSLPSAVSLCARLGADILHAGHMVHAAVREQEKMIAYEHFRRNQWKIFLSRFSVLWHQVALRLPCVSETPVPTCSKNPVENLFIGSDGSVSPCVYLNPPLNGSFPRIVNGQPLQISRVIMGNLNEMSLDKIWDSKPYRQFREVFRNRIRFYDAIMSGLVPDLLAMEKLERSRERIRRLFSTTLLPPESCRGCPLLSGF